ncbi:MAG: MarR family transcriptional regulator [Halococcoides sp.]
MKTVTPGCHEFDANLLFNEDRLQPFFAADSVVKAAEGSKTVEFSADSETWQARLSYQDSNIVHPGEETPQGTPWALESMREYRIRIFRAAEEDPYRQQDFTAHIAPRWEGMQAEKSDGARVEIPVPSGFGEGINARVQGSNVAFDRYPDLLARAAAALGIAGRFFREPHGMSNIQDAERYVRVRDDRSGPVHARDGPIASMGHLLEDDRSGYRKVVQNDDDGHGRNQPGYYHTATLDERRIREAFPDHCLPKEVKHYYSREAKSLPDDHTLAHPKVGVSLQHSLLDDDETVYWSDLERVERELDQTVLSVLADAGLDVAPSDGSGPFVESDAYWDPVVDESGPNPVGLDLTRIRHEQESIVVRHLADGLSPVENDILTTLDEDGSVLSPADLAAENDRHVDSVRRRLRDMEDLVHHEYAEVSLRSDYVAELVHDAVTEARESVTRAADTVATAIEAAERGMGETMTAFIAWAARHGVDVDDPRDARMRLRFGEAVDDVGAAIREGFRVWTDAGMPEERYREAQVRFPDGSLGDAWRWLEPG